MLLEEYPQAADSEGAAPQRAKLLAAVTHYLDGDYELSQEVLEELWQELTAEDPPPPEIYESAHLATRNLFSLGDLDGLNRWLEDCTDRGLNDGPIPLLQLMRIRRDFILGDSAAALAGVNGYLERQVGRLSPHVPEFLCLRSVTHEMLGDLDQAVQDMEMAYQLARYLNHPRSVMNYADWLGILNKQLSRYSESLKWFERAAGHSAGFAKRSPRIYHNTAITLYKLGRFREALEVLNRFQTTDCLKPEHRSFKLSCLALSRVHCLLRDFDKARKQIRTLEPLIQDPEHFPRERALIAEFLADIHLAEGQIETARSLYRKSLDLARGTPAAEELAMTLHRRLGECQYLAGDIDGGLAELNEALALARTRRDRFEEGVALRTLAEAHLAGGDRRGARTAVDQAIAGLGEIEARHEQAVALLRSAELTLAEMKDEERDISSLILVNRAWSEATHSLDLFLKVGVDWWTEQARHLLQKISRLKDRREQAGDRQPAAE